MSSTIILTGRRSVFGHKLAFGHWPSVTCVAYCINTSVAMLPVGLQLAFSLHSRPALIDCG